MDEFEGIGKPEQQDSPSLGNTGHSSVILRPENCNWALGKRQPVQHKLSHQCCGWAYIELCQILDCLQTSISCEILATPHIDNYPFMESTSGITLSTIAWFHALLTSGVDKPTKWSLYVGCYSTNWTVISSLTCLFPASTRSYPLRPFPRKPDGHAAHSYPSSYSTHCTPS